MPLKSGIYAILLFTSFFVRRRYCPLADLDFAKCLALKVGEFFCLNVGISLSVGDSRIFPRLVMLAKMGEYFLKRFFFILKRIF